LHQVSGAKPTPRQRHVEDHPDQQQQQPSVGKEDEENSYRYLITPKHLVHKYPDDTGSSLKHKITRYDMMQDDEAHVLKVKQHEVE